MMKKITTKYKKYLTDEEIVLLDNFFNEQIPPIRIVYFFMRYLGLRVSDACSIKIEELQEGKLIKTMKKTKQILELPIPMKVLSYLNCYITLEKHQIIKHNGYLAYSTRTGTYIKEGTLREIFHQFREKYKLNTPYYIQRNTNIPMYRICCHSLRHFIANKLYKSSGHDIKLVQAVLGHTRADTTQNIYISKPDGIRIGEELEKLT